MPPSLEQGNEFAQLAYLAMAGLQVEQAACRRETAAAARQQESEPNPAWDGASHGTDAHAAARADGAWYADENKQTRPQSCSRAETLTHQQWQSIGPGKAGCEGSKLTNGTTAPAADSQHRQQRLQQLYQELQLLAGDALQPRSCSPCR